MHVFMLTTGLSSSPQSQGKRCLGLPPVACVRYRVYSCHRHTLEYILSRAAQRYVELSSTLFELCDLYTLCLFVTGLPVVCFKQWSIFVFVPGGHALVVRADAATTRIRLLIAGLGNTFGASQNWGTRCRCCHESSIKCHDCCSATKAESVRVQSMLNVTNVIQTAVLESEVFRCVP